MPVETPTNPAAAPDLRVDVAALRRRGVDRHHVAVDLSVAWLASVLVGTDAEPRDPGHVELDLQLPVDGPVIVAGTLRAGFEVPCGRCLDPANVSADGQVSATYVPASAVAMPTDDTSDEDGLGLSADDLDTWTYADTTVDLSLMVAEAVKVAYPMRALCSRGEDCRGLCSNCGAALNNQPLAPTCAACGYAVGPGEGTENPASEPADGPLASALRKLQLPE